MLLCFWRLWCPLYPLEVHHIRFFGEGNLLLMGQKNKRGIYVLSSWVDTLSFIVIESISLGSNPALPFHISISSHNFVSRNLVSVLKRNSFSGFMRACLPACHFFKRRGQSQRSFALKQTHYLFLFCFFNMKSQYRYRYGPIRVKVQTRCWIKCELGKMVLNNWLKDANSKVLKSLAQ